METRDVKLYDRTGENLMALVKTADTHYDVVIWNGQIFVWRNVEQKYCLAKATSV